MRPDRSLAAAVLLGVALSMAPGLVAQEPAPAAEEEKEEKRIEIGGFVDVYYSLNGNRPFNRESFFPGAGVAAKRSEEFALNFAALEIRRDPDPVGFHLIAARP